MLKNKKGFLLGEETLKIIIAVVCIAFLAYVFFSLYNLYLKNKDLEKAKASLNHLIEEISAGKEEVKIYNPSGWGLSSFQGEVPNICSNKGWERCICVCKIGTFTASGESFVEQCNRNNNGICLESDYNVEGKGIVISMPPVILSIDHENKIIREK